MRRKAKHTWREYETSEDISSELKINPPVPVAARSKASVCGRSPAEIVGSSPPGGHGYLSVCCKVEVSAMR
jgi:hypothetical protein